MFTGQGSQRVGMGDDLTRDFEPVVRHVWEEANTAVGYNLRKVMSDGPADALAATEHTQPALLAHGVALWRVLQHHLGFASLAPWAGLALGHSLGEYTALCCADALPFSRALQVVRARGLAMAAVARAELDRKRPTAMAALMPCSEALADAVVAAVRRELPDAVLAVANINSDAQVVLSGHRVAIDRAIAIATQRTHTRVTTTTDTAAAAAATTRDASAAAAATAAAASNSAVLGSHPRVRRAVLLDVSAPFHSPLMAPTVNDAIARALGGAAASVMAHAPAVPIVSNATAVARRTSAELWEATMAQTASPVRWRDSLHYCVQSTDVPAAARNDRFRFPEVPTREFVELGPAPVLTPLVRQCAFRFDATARERYDPTVSAHALHDTATLRQYLSSFR